MRGSHGGYEGYVKLSGDVFAPHLWLGEVGKVRIRQSQGQVWRTSTVATRDKHGRYKRSSESTAHQVPAVRPNLPGSIVNALLYEDVQGSEFRDQKMRGISYMYRGLGLEHVNGAADTAIRHMLPEKELKGAPCFQRWKPVIYTISENNGSKRLERNPGLVMT